MLAAGVAVNCRDERKCTPLMLAARGGHTDTVALLKGAGANLHLRDCEGNTATRMAARSVAHLLPRPRRRGVCANRTTAWPCHCGRHFDCESKLRRHWLVHTGRSDHRCACGKAYTQAATLRLHQRRARHGPHSR
ncbi:MAG: ankyrin repeat domain-containing protein [Polyangiales bacterium]